jgi:hypothetical protein
MIQLARSNVNKGVFGPFLIPFRLFIGFKGYLYPWADRQISFRRGSSVQSALFFLTQPGKKSEILPSHFVDLDLTSPLKEHNPFGLTLGVNQITFNEGECNFGIAENLVFPPISQAKSLSVSDFPDLGNSQNRASGKRDDLF